MSRLHLTVVVLSVLLLLLCDRTVFGGQEYSLLLNDGLGCNPAGPTAPSSEKDFYYCSYFGRPSIRFVSKK